MKHILIGLTLLTSYSAFSAQLDISKYLGTYEGLATDGKTKCELTIKEYKTWINENTGRFLVEIINTGGNEKERSLSVERFLYKNHDQYYYEVSVDNLNLNTSIGLKNNGEINFLNLENRDTMNCSSLTKL